MISRNSVKIERLNNVFSKYSFPDEELVEKTYIKNIITLKLFRRKQDKRSTNNDV